MYMVQVKTLLTEALRRTFSSAYPVPSVQNLYISIEFPVAKQNYPSIWVDFEPVGDLEVAGIDHKEFLPSTTPGVVNQHTRWRYQGHATFTVAALTSLERDTIYDELVRVMAFGRENPGTSEFRAMVENNGYIAANIDFDQISQRGFAASPGTPWGTDEVIYEGTLAMEIFGEFLSDVTTGALVPISAISVTEYTDQESDPNPW